MQQEEKNERRQEETEERITTTDGLNFSVKKSQNKSRYH